MTADPPGTVKRTLPAPSNGCRRFQGLSRLSRYNLTGHEGSENSSMIGQGTFGSVFLTHDERGRKVAIKKILIDDPKSTKEGFPLISLREIAILRRIDHQNIVPLYDLIIEPKGAAPSKHPTRKPATIYMVFPFMDHDLMGLIDNQEAQLLPPHVKCYTRQILTGLAHLHARGIMHRDMKCANILINNDGNLRIADFGLARRLISSKRAESRYTMPVVTRYYRPPELLLGQSTYERYIDVWGVGVIICEMIVRQFMFPGQSDLATLAAIVDLCGTGPRWPPDNWKSLPQAVQGALPNGEANTPDKFGITFKGWGNDLHELLHGLMHYDPHKRFSASGALQHRFFFTDPLPCEPKDCPRYTKSFFELNARADRQHKKAPRREMVSDVRQAHHGVNRNKYESTTQSMANALPTRTHYQ